MPRRKPASAKQHKAELQLKRAIKRGDIPAPPPQSKPPRGKKARRNPQGGIADVKTSDPSSKRLQSAFLKAEPEFLQKSKLLAATEKLPRPLLAEAAVLNGDEVGLCLGDVELLTCPKRPKWRFDMDKKEVEKNEEGIFRKWMTEIDECVEAWRAPRSVEPPPEGPLPGDQEAETSFEVPGSPTYYERNIEVWRQLWRVSEISQIILLLLDSRCPAVHFPPSLHTYLTSLRPPRPLILVLTKSDLVPASYTAAWSKWLRDRYPSVRVVKVESYCERDGQEERKGQGKRKRFDPEMKDGDLHELVDALKVAHAELITPPEKVTNDEERVKKWKPTVRQAIDWRAAMKAGRTPIDQPVDDSGQEFITIGLVGQPNVGKSSLLNALFGAHKVKASRTPGKTKHFQTLFWTPQIRLVDCPGLVMPNFVHMELQVLCGTLPISQIPSIPACIHYTLRILPLEQILRLTHPSDTAQVPEDKRTWRGDRSATQPPKAAQFTSWTAMDMLTAYAAKRGWVTAKAGRPDANRAGNALLRTLAEGRIRWAFWPPGVPLPDSIAREGRGVWLGDAVMEDTEDEDDGSDAESSEQESLESARTQGDTSQRGEGEGEDAEEEATSVGAGRFGALALDSSENSGESDPET